MQDLTFRRFGWSDWVGPLWFLKERWNAGPRWRPGWARFFAGQLGVAMQLHTKREGYAVRGFFIPSLLWRDLSYSQKEDVVLSWIKSVRRPDSPNGLAGRPADPVWMSEYPAVHDYLVVGENPDGSLRRTATLTLFADAASWKC